MLRRSFPVRALALSALIVLLAPAAAMADTFDAAGKGLPDSVGINSLWVIVAGCFVMFMQAGFAPKSKRPAPPSLRANDPG